MREEMWLESWLLGSWIQVLGAVGMHAYAYVSMCLYGHVYSRRSVSGFIYFSVLRGMCLHLHGHTCQCAP